MSIGITNRIRRSVGLFVLNHFFCMTRMFSFKRKLLKFSAIHVGKNTKIVGPLKCGNVVTITIGDDCWIGSDLKIYGNGQVAISDHCDFAPGISIITGSHEVGYVERRAGEGVALKVDIGKGCWIGANSTLLGNCIVGEGSVVGACSLVNKNIPPNTIAVGSPAKKIKELKPLEEKQR